MFLISVLVPSSVVPRGRTRDVGVAAQRALLHVAVADAERARACRAAGAGRRAASAEVRMSGSVTISTSGVPPRLKSTSECRRRRGPPPPVWTSLPASSSRWTRVMPHRGSLAVGGRTLERPPIAERLVVLGDLVGLGQVGIEVVLAVEAASARRSRSRAPGPMRIASSTRLALSTGSTPGGPRHTGQMWVLGGVAEARARSRRTSWCAWELDVDLEPDDRLPAAMRSPSLMRRPAGPASKAERAARGRAAASSSRFSPKAGPTSWSPTGRPVGQARTGSRSPGSAGQVHRDRADVGQVHRQRVGRPARRAGTPTSARSGDSRTSHRLERRARSRCVMSVRTFCACA